MQEESYNNVSDITADQSAVDGKIDKAVLRYTRSGRSEIVISGWLLYKHTSIVIIQFGLPGSEICLARKTESPEIEERFPNVPGSNYAGFNAVLPLSDRSASLEEIYFTAILENGLIIAGALELPEMYIQSRPQEDNSSKSTDNLNFKKALSNNSNEQPLKEKNNELNTFKKVEDEKSNLEQVTDDYNNLVEEYQSSAHLRLMKFIHSNDRIVFPTLENPSVSVILVLHNKAEYSLDCLLSLMKSEYRNFEVIIVDNASIDYTKVLLSKVQGAKIVTNDKNLHFIRGANQAAELSSAQTLLFLNNDACVSVNAIESAKETLSKNGVGAVGGRIVKIDGKLQEAGCVLLSNGGCYGYGVGDSPEDFKYLFGRKVDFCSGTFLMTSKELFVSLGGFEESYAPAYYEDVDYCLKLLKNGYETRYDPRCLVVHVEHGSSSREEAKKLLKKNVEILRERHSDVLYNFPDLTSSKKLFGRSAADKRKKVLIIDDTVPFSRKGSGCPRINKLIKALEVIGLDVTLYITNLQEKLTWNEIKDEFSLSVEFNLKSGKSALLSFLEQRMKFYDKIVISRPHNIEFFNSIFSHLNNDSLKEKLIYDSEALFSERELRKYEIANNVILTEDEKNYVISKEVGLTEFASRIVAVSQNDGSKFNKFTNKNVEIISYAVKPLLGSTSFNNRKDIIFTGPLRKIDSPNYDALSWFIKSVLPIMEKEYSFNDYVHVYGEINPEVVSSLKRQNIIFHGTYQYNEDIYKNIKLSIAPMRIASGIPIKVIEASSFGVPTVATELVSELLSWEKQRDIAVAHSVESFAYACHVLYTDEEIWSSIRNFSFEKVKENYSEKQFIESVAKVFL